MKKVQTVVSKKEIKVNPKKSKKTGLINENAGEYAQVHSSLFIAGAFGFGSIYKQKSSVDKLGNKYSEERNGKKSIPTIKNIVFVLRVIFIILISFVYFFMFYQRFLNCQNKFTVSRNNIIVK